MLGFQLVGYSCCGTEGDKFDILPSEKALDVENYLITSALSIPNSYTGVGFPARLIGFRTKVGENGTGTNKSIRSITPIFDTSGCEHSWIWTGGTIMQIFYVVGSDVPKEEK